MNKPSLLKADLGRLVTVGLLFAAAVIAVNLMVDQFDSEAGRGTALNLRFYCGVILFWSLPVLAVSQGSRLRNALDQLGRLADSGSRAGPGHRLLSMATGIRFMALLALALYAGSLLCLLVASRRLAAGARRI